MTCARCAGEAELELHRFGDEATTAEPVCRGCCTHTEAAIAARFDEPDQQAFVLALTDAIDRLVLPQACRA